MPTQEEENLEYKLTHPDAITSSNSYDFDGTRIRIRYFVDDIDYKDDGLYGSLVFVIEKWDNSLKNYRELFSSSLERRLIINSRGYYDTMGNYINKEEEIKKHYSDIFFMEYEQLLKSNKLYNRDKHILSPKMIEDTLDNLFISLKQQYYKHHNEEFY